MQGPLLVWTQPAESQCDHELLRRKHTGVVRRDLYRHRDATGQKARLHSSPGHKGPHFATQVCCFLIQRMKRGAGRGVPSGRHHTSVFSGTDARALSLGADD